MTRNEKAFYLNLLLIIMFFLVGFMVRGSDTGILFDIKVMEYIHSNPAPIGIYTMKIISYLGSGKFILYLSILILALMLKRHNTSGIKLLFLSTLGSYILNEGLKHIFIRTRPLEYFLVNQGGYSYPSGHSMVSLTFYTTMTYVLLKNIRDTKIEKFIWIINTLTILLIGFSRIYLGVHWPTDVLAGYAVGFCFYNVSKTLIEKHGAVHHK